MVAFVKAAGKLGKQIVALPPAAARTPAFAGRCGPSLCVTGLGVWVSL